MKAALFALLIVTAPMTVSAEEGKEEGGARWDFKAPTEAVSHYLPKGAPPWCTTIPGSEEIDCYLMSQINDGPGPVDSGIPLPPPPPVPTV